MTPNSKRTRGIRYIASALDKYYKNRYVTYSERLERARELQSNFKKSGKTATIRSIKSIEKGLISRGRPTKDEVQKRQKKKKQKKKKERGPELNRELLEPKHYWNLTEYPNLIKISPEDVVFISEVSPEGIDPVLGGQNVQYGPYFSEYVKYMNSVKKDEEDEDTYQSEWYIRCTEPEKDDKTGQWISYIVTCDADGNITDYGYSKSRTQAKKQKGARGGDKKQKKSTDDTRGEKTGPIEPITSKKGDKTEAVRLKELEIIQKEKEIQLEKARAIKEALTAYNQNLLTKMELKEILNALK